MKGLARGVGAAKHIGKYSDAIETETGLRWLFTSGTPGVAERMERFPPASRLNRALHGNTSLRRLREPG
jgi:hypothetical protein